MELETKIFLGLWLSLVFGAAAGWYLAWIHYREENVRRKAVEAYKKHLLVSRPPLSCEERLGNAMLELKDIGVDEYRIVDGGRIFELRRTDSSDSD